MGTHPNFRFGTEKNESICLDCFGGCPKIFHKHHRIAQFRWEPLRIIDWSAATLQPSRDMNNQQHMSQHDNSSFRLRVLLHSGGTNKRFSDLSNWCVLFRHGMVDAKAPGAHAWKDDAVPNHGTRSTKTRASKTNQVELNRPQHIERRVPCRFGIGTIDRMFSSQPTAGLLLWGHACVFWRVRDDSRSHNQVDGTKEVQDHSAPGTATGCWQDSL